MEKEENGRRLALAFACESVDRIPGGAGKQGNDDKEMRAAGRLKNAPPPNNPQFL